MSFSEKLVRKDWGAHKKYLDFDEKDYPLYRLGYIRGYRQAEREVVR